MAEEPAIIRAIKSGLPAEVKSLLEKQPEILQTGTGQHGESFLLLSVYHGNKAVTDILLQHQTELSIHEAAATGNVERVKKLVEQDKTLVNIASADGFSSLGLACFFGYPEIAKYLIDQGAKINIPSKNKMNVQPLHSAIAAKNIEMVTYLLEQGADVNVRQTGGFTPLHAAAQQGNGELIKLLLTHGADINATTDAGETPMELAIKSGHEAASWFSL